MFSTARWRLALWFAGAFAVILVLIGGAVYLTTRTALYDQVDDDLQTRNDALLTALIQQSRGPLGPRIQRDDFRLAARLLSAGGYSAAIVVEGEDEPVGTANIEEIVIPPFEELHADVGDGVAIIDTTTSDGEDIRLRVERLGPNSYITVGRSIEPEQQALQRLFVVLAGGGLVGVALASVGGFLLAGRALRPIRSAMDAQRTFVADASHELRTPLALIRANAEVMKRERASEGGGEGGETVDDIIKETDHLSYLVGQMLTLARADVRESPFASEDVDLAALASDVVREAQVLAQERGIRLAFTGDGARHVTGDGQRLREALLILLDNAFKYTDEGGIVAVSVNGEGSRVRLAVTDNGHGIPEDDLPHVFDRFYRVDKARSRELGGTGLGLAIARWITEEHGGSIGVESIVGTGTTVTVDLPARPAGAS